MGRRLGIYTLGHYMSLDTALSKKLWNPLLENFESWEVSEIRLKNYDVITQSIEGMLLTQEQILGGYFPLRERVEKLKNVKAEFLKNFDNLVQILSMEVQKPLSLSRGECERCVATIDATIAYGEKLLADGAIERGETKSFKGESAPRPRKLVLGLTPFNFPLNLCLHKIAPAILAGAPLIWRPSSKGQLTALALVDVLHAAKIPAGVLGFLPMDNETFWKLLNDPRIDAVSFTGSAKVGWEIHGKFKGATVLELGGSAPIYVEKLQGEELRKALSEICTSAYAYAGQSCISAQSVFVHKDVFDESKKILQELTVNFATGKTWDEKTLCSGVIDEAAKLRIDKTLSDAEAMGSKLTRATYKDIPNFVPPTLVENANEQLLKEEVFAPVLNLQAAGSFADFLDFANALPHRLQCAVYSNDAETLSKSELLDFGGVSLNGPSSQRVDALPYGGRGLAGLGAENPATSYHFFAPHKTFYRK
jgi:acyl-CoA reductase-like NAD-dependent aldehyde dehydrogenase